MENCISSVTEIALVPILVWEKIAIYLFLGDQSFRKHAVFKHARAADAGNYAQ